jgi:hypothetical protein
MALTEDKPKEISKGQLAFALFIVFIGLGIGEIVRSFSFGTNLWHISMYCSINISGLFSGLAIIIFGLIFWWKFGANNG